MAWVSTERRCAFPVSVKSYGLTNGGYLVVIKLQIS